MTFYYVYDVVLTKRKVEIVENYSASSLGRAA